MKNINKWIDFKFESSCTVTEEFTAFVKDFKKEIKKAIPENMELVKFSKGHFEVYGFIKLKESNKYIYFSISDVRYSQNEWYNNILIRTAQNEKDYTGGPNQYTSLENFKNKIENIYN